MAKTSFGQGKDCLRVRMRKHYDTMGEMLLRLLLLVLHLMCVICCRRCATFLVVQCALPSGDIRHAVPHTMPPFCARGTLFSAVASHSPTAQASPRHL